MSGSQPNIILGFRPTPNVGPVFDPAQGIDNAQRMMQIQQQGLAIKRQNALMGLFGNPGAIDQTGQPTPETIQKAIAIDPQFGLNLSQNSMLNQQRKMQQQYYQSEMAASNADRISEAYAPVVEKFDDEIKNGVPIEQANQHAQEGLVTVKKSLGDSGFNPELLKKAPDKWDRNQIGLLVTNSKGFRDWQKEQLANKRLEQTGTNREVDNEGRPFVNRPNAPVGKQNVYDDNTTVPPEKLPGARKMGSGGTGSATQQENQRWADIGRYKWEKAHGGPATTDEEKADLLQAQQDEINKGREAAAKAKTAGTIEAGGGSAAVQDRRDIEFTERHKYEGELGHAVESDAEKAELKSRVLARENQRKVDLAGQTAGARQGATAKPIDVIVDGKPQQATWKNQKYYDLQGNEIASTNIRSAGKSGTPAQSAERDAMIVADSRIAAEEQKRGGPMTEEEKAEFRRTARADPKVQEAIRKSEGTAISDDAAKLTAEETLRGDWHGTVGMGRNAASMKKIADWRGILAKEAGMTGADLAANTAEFQGIVAAERILGTRGAGIDLGIAEAQKFAPMVIAASDAINRSQYPTWNAVQLAWSKGTGGEPVIRLIDAMNAYKMAYTQILTRGGMPTDDARRRSDEIIDKSWSNGQIRTALDQLDQEMRAAQSAVPAVRDNLYFALTGKHRNTEPQQQPNQPVQSDIDWLRKNPSTREKFDQHFGPGSADKHLTPQSAPQQTGQPKPEARPAQAPTQQVARPTTQEEYNKLPSGTSYINPADGKTYKKQ